MIRASRLFVIDADGKQRGEIPLSEALKLADEAGFDLVEVSPNANPPVAKILDFGKYKYDQTKAASRQKKNQHDVVVKEIRLGPTMGEHDLMVKVKQGEKFIKQGHKLKVSVLFRGRMIAHLDLGAEILSKFIDRLGEQAKMEQAPIRQGRSIHIIVAPR
jgi:translation initiation factor IF-3